MRTVNPLPLTTFSQVDYPIELENMYDYDQNLTITPVVGFEGEKAIITLSKANIVAVDDIIFITIVRNESGTLFLSEEEATVTAISPTTIEVFQGEGDLPAVVAKCSFRVDGLTTPFDVTFGLQPSGGTTTNFRIRANSAGKGKVFIGEILRQYLPEFLAPKDYEEAFINNNNKTVGILFNGASNNINIKYGSKYLDVNNYFVILRDGINPLNQKLKLFQEQILGYVSYPSNTFAQLFTNGYSIGDNGIFNLYPSIPCKNKIYLSSNYGLLEDGELIDVSVPVLAFVNRAGQYEYIRFTGSNVNKYNVQEARLKQDYASTLTNADIGLIYEGIELTLADDNTNQGFAYRIDKLELQRCLALLMESPKAWLLVNGDLQQALEVRVKRESVVFASSFDKTYGNYTAQCEVIITQTLGQPQY
jgi:hypothetical protein